MFNKKLLFAFMAMALITFCFESSLYSKPKELPKKDKNNNEQEQTHTPREFDLQQNTVSNFSFYTTNYGIFGENIDQNVGGGYWPRGSQNQYIFGGGIWFGAVKKRPKLNPNDTTVYGKLVEVSYNPNNGRSWMTPGSIEDDINNVRPDIATRTEKYRLYFSTDMRNSDGGPLDATYAKYPWPIWDSSTNPYDTLKAKHYLGNYIYDENSRNNQTYPRGPAFISGEDIFCDFKDTDLNQFDGGKSFREKLGYPLDLQFEETIYSWGFGDYKDFIFIRYNIINFSKDTLLQCWMGSVIDADIARQINSQQGASDDHVRFYNEDPSKNLGLQWTGTQYGEAGYGFGYVGFKFLESPALDSLGFIRKDSSFFDVNSQLGLVTFQNWVISDDKNADGERYDFMASRQLQGDNGAGDKRIMMATGPFNYRPSDTAHLVVGMIFAGTGNGGEADGSKTDASLLVSKADFAQLVYDNNFKAPKPPDQCVLLNWKPLNNAIQIHWDSTSEMSIDKEEGGLDFLGYKIFRARRVDLDTFSVNNESPNNQYSGGKGPFGWKQVAQWELPTPFTKSAVKSQVSTDPTIPYIDSLRIVGPNFMADGVTPDPWSIRVFRDGKGVIFNGYSQYAYDTCQRYLHNFGEVDSTAIFPVIEAIDTLSYSQPWGPFYDSVSKGGAQFPIWFDPYKPSVSKGFLVDSILLGTVQIDSHLVKYNPLYFYRYVTTFATLKSGGPDTAGIKEVMPNGNVNILSTLRLDYVNGAYQWEMDQMRPIQWNTTMLDTRHILDATDSIYAFIQRGWAKTVFWDFEGSDTCRHHVITAYMDKITNHRTFIDNGDDNHNGNINFDADPTKTEKLLNNMDYFYKVLAYDEGDYNKKTPEKINQGGPQQPDFDTCSPKAAPVGNQTSFNVTYVDSSKIGGLYNFQLFTIDPDKAAQQFGGHTLTLQFEPFWSGGTITFIDGSSQTNASLYYRRLVLTDSNTNTVLFDGITQLEAELCNFTFYGSFTETPSTWFYTAKPIYDTLRTPTDTNTFGSDANNKQIYVRSGSFNSGTFGTTGSPGVCYSGYWSQEGQQILGFSFDYTVQQWGGAIRSDESSNQLVIDSTTGNTVKTPVITNGNTAAEGYHSENVDTTVVMNFWNDSTGKFYDKIYEPAQINFGSYNNGPGVYRITFSDNGNQFEPMTIDWDTAVSNSSATFNVPYLNVKVENIISYNRTSENGDSVPVTYPAPMKQVDLGLFFNTKTDQLVIEPGSLKDSSNNFIGNFNLISYGAVNWRNEKKRFNFQPHVAYMNNNRKNHPWVGTQGRYYLSAYSNNDTLDFMNVFDIAGCEFNFDYANFGFKNNSLGWTRQTKYLYAQDFKPGDTVIVRTDGGALGLPLPGATVKFKISSTNSKGSSLTNSMMDQIRVVPNPYYITQQGQKSAYDAQIYFTKLPPVCTINIYTEAGDLVRTLQHDETTSSDPSVESVAVWNLMSRNAQRVQSQTLVAIITTPGGAQTVQKFTLVVGGFRLIPDTGN